MVHVRDSRHRVDLEVLVGAERRGFLNGSPVRERWLRVVEPLVAEVLHVISIQMAYTLCDLRPWHSAVEIKHLWSNLLHDIRCCLNAHKFVPKDVTSTNNLMLTDELAIESWHGHTTPVHLPSENLIAEEPVAEDATVAVGAVQTLCTSDVWKVTKHGVHRIVLFLHIIKMCCMLVDFILTNHALEHKECVEVLVLPRWCIVENTDRGVEHLIVSDHEQSGVEDGLLHVEHGLGSGAGQRREVLLYQIDELLVSDGACTHDDHIFAEIVSLMVVDNHVTRDLTDIINVAENGLSHHVLSEDVIVDVLHECLLWVLVHSFEFLPYCVFFQLDVVAVICAVAEHISHDLNGTRYSIREAESMVHGVLTACVSIELSSSVLNFHFELPARAIGSALEMQVLQEVRRTGTLNSLVARA